MSKINLIIQYCNSSNLERQKEFDYCLIKNLENPHIEKIYSLVEEGIKTPETFINHPKYSEHIIGEWLTFDKAFEFANGIIGSQKIVALCNLDIFLTHNSPWQNLANILQNNIVLCLSRYELTDEGQLILHPSYQKLLMANSQDCWIFKTPISVKDAEFPIGILGCDNAIAHRLKQSGYFPLNDCTNFKIIHYDLCRNQQQQSQRYHNQYLAEINRICPEKKGQFLLPGWEFSQNLALDDLLERLNATPLQRYEIFCEVFSKFIKVVNNNS